MQLAILLTKKDRLTPVATRHDMIQTLRPFRCEAAAQPSHSPRIYVNFC